MLRLILKILAFFFDPKRSEKKARSTLLRRIKDIRKERDEGLRTNNSDLVSWADSQLERLREEIRLLQRR